MDLKGNRGVVLDRTGPDQTVGDKHGLRICAGRVLNDPKYTVSNWTVHRSNSETTPRDKMNPKIFSRSLVAYVHPASHSLAWVSPSSQLHSGHAPSTNLAGMSQMFSHEEEEEEDWEVIAVSRRDGN